MDNETLTGLNKYRTCSNRYGIDLKRVCFGGINRADQNIDTDKLTFTGKVLGRESDFMVFLNSSSRIPG
jgi:hypothetical protein